MELVESDVTEGYVSIESASEDYGVVIDPETGKVDLKASQKLRKALKKS